ncbi:MAG: TetR/AcrR family transcriptional regulator [Clostridiales bacterium]|jgi:AcrR family transcriptional regulator|nr:TetR/AcrR family transcriptional regulator [Clostridiales bacterium]
MENQRIRLTKQLLRDSLTSLLYEKSIHKITVSEICVKAQINRTTFYKYYGSQYDLFNDMENEVLAQIDKYLEANSDSLVGLQQVANIISFVNSNLGFCRILANNSVDSDFPEKLMNRPRIKQLLNSMLGGYGEKEQEYINSFVVNGCFSMAKIWLNKESREPPEFIAELLTSTITKLFSTAKNQEHFSK